MKIGWISPYLPAPATSGGSIRQQRLAAALAAHGDVHLFARGELWEAVRARRAGLDMFRTIWVGRDYVPRFTGETRSSRVRRGSPASLYRAAFDLHRRIGLDVLVVAHSWAALGAERMNLPWVLDEHNVESRFFQELDRAKGRSGARAYAEVEALSRWERAVWSRATGLTCVSEEDRDVIARHRSRGPIAVLENGTDLAVAKTRAASPDGGVVFVGSMHHRPNVEAAERLLSGIAPKVWASAPGLRFTIVGGPVPRSVRIAHRALARREQVAITGIVGDVAPYLAEAQVYANPMRHGAGSSLKIAQALAAGVPIVSSECGARGFGMVPGAHYLQAETDDEHAQAILRVVEEVELAAALAHEGRELVSRFGWSAIGRRFVDVVKTAIVEASRKS